MKTKILVTGANGYVGNSLVLALLNRTKEFTVKAAARHGSILHSKELEAFKVGSLEDNPDYQEALRGIDVVIHCAAKVSPRKTHGWTDQTAYRRANVLGTAHLAREAHRAGVKRFVFVSSIQANGEVTPPGKKFYPDSLPRPKRAFGISMLMAEKELKRVGEETGMEIVIVRAPMVYGPESKNLFSACQKMQKYCLPLPFLWCKNNRRSMVSIDNLVDFLIKAACHPKAANELFLVSDGHDLSTYEIFKLLAQTSHRPCLLWPFPIALLRLFNSYIGRIAWDEFFFESQAVDLAKAKLVLDWTPPESVEAGFKRSWEERQVVQ